MWTRPFVKTGMRGMNETVDEDAGERESGVVHLYSVLAAG